MYYAYRELIMHIVNSSWLTLRNNSLAGFEIISSHLWKLESLDLSHNQLTGSITSKLHSLYQENWGIYIYMLSCIILISKRYFHHYFDSFEINCIGWCELKNLKQLDLSGNNFGGLLPYCLGNLSSLQLLSHVRKSARRRLVIFRCCVIWFDSVCWSRHLVIYWRLLGNRMYWSCQRFAGKGLVVVRKGISTPNTPYLR